MSPMESKDLEKRLILLTIVMSIVLICAQFCGCTMSIIVTDTHGEADDVVDSSPKADANIEANADFAKIPGSTIKA